jgi:uncharacterized protein (TIGR02145 family)
MKKMQQSTLFFTMTILFLSTACKQNEVVLKTFFSETTIDNITENSADLTTDILEVGNNLNSYGHCYSTNETPTVYDDRTVNNGVNAEQGSFTDHITDLAPNTTYYVRVYAEEDSIRYGSKIYSFTTLSNRVPTVTTADTTSVSETSAVAGGEVTDEGTTAVNVRGVCWNKTGSPSDTDSKTEDGIGTGTFTSNMGGLDPSTTYYYRAYATNDDGTGYGSEKSFTTDDAPYITILTPTGTDHWVGGNSYDITWETNISEDVLINLYKNGTYNRSISSGTSGVLYNWEIPGDLVYSSDYTIRVISSSDNTINDESEEFILSEPTGSPGTVTDFDGNSYATVKIEKQWWMAENLKSISYADGTVMTNGSAEGDITEDYTTRYYFNYGNDPANVAIYGRLYTWAAAMKGTSGSDTNPSGVQGVCPNGWHVPSDSEWMELETELGMLTSELTQTGNRGTHNEGGKLKQVETTLWSSPNTGATDEFDFTALPGGFFYFGGVYLELTQGSYFWSTSSEGTDAYIRGLFYNNDQINRTVFDKAMGTSVRCVKN